MNHSFVIALHSFQFVRLSNLTCTLFSYRLSFHTILSLKIHSTAATPILQEASMEPSHKKPRGRPLKDTADDDSHLGGTYPNHLLPLKEIPNLIAVATSGSRPISPTFIQPSQGGRFRNPSEEDPRPRNSAREHEQHVLGSERCNAESGGGSDFVKAGISDSGCYEPRPGECEVRRRARGREADCRL